MFRNMEYILCVYKERSFSKAAEKLRISQPSLSATVKKIEEKAGSPIFDRKTTPVSLTAFGVEYIRGAEQICGIQERIQNIAYELDTLQSGNLSIGGSNLSIPNIVPKVICDFKKAYPHINLRILETSTLQSKHLLDSGEIDLIITNRPLNTDEYKRIFFYHEYLLLAVPRDFTVNASLQAKQLTASDFARGLDMVAADKCVYPVEFADVPLILLHKDNYLRLCTDMLFDEEQVVPNIVLEAEQSAISYNFAKYGLGATILSNTLIEDINNDSSLVFYKIGGKYAWRDKYICYRKKGGSTIAMQKFIETATRRVEDDK